MARHILSLTFEDEDAVSACFHAGLGDPLVLHLRAYGEHETDLLFCVQIGVGHSSEYMGNMLPSSLPLDYYKNEKKYCFANNALNHAAKNAFSWRREGFEIWSIE